MPHAAAIGGIVFLCPNPNSAACGRARIVVTRVAVAPLGAAAAVGLSNTVLVRVMRMRVLDSVLPLLRRNVGLVSFVIGAHSEASGVRQGARGRR